MSAGHLSRLETGDYGPPSDEVIERLAVELKTDPVELLRIAGREVGSRSFEQHVLADAAAHLFRHRATGATAAGNQQDGST